MRARASHRYCSAGVVRETAAAPVASLEEEGGVLVSVPDAEAGGGG